MISFLVILSINRSLMAAGRPRGGARFSPNPGTATRPARRPACRSGVCYCAGRMRDRPYEAERLACDRRDRHDAELAARGEPAVAAAETVTCLLGDGAHRGRVAPGTGGCCLGAPGVGPGCFDQHFAGAAFAGLCQPPPPYLIAGRMLARHHAEIPHQLARAGKAPRIADLGHQTRRIDEPISTQEIG